MFVGALFCSWAKGGGQESPYSHASVRFHSFWQVYVDAVRAAGTDY